MIHVLLFRPEFVSDIVSGHKWQTIRERTRHPVHVGDLLSLRTWQGKPYRSKQVEIAKATCDELLRVEIYSCPMLCRIDSEEVSATSLAEADGFTCFSQMVEWLETHGYKLPFRGVAIRWRKTWTGESG